jgi:hypothetical protein
MEQKYGKGHKKSEYKQINQESNQANEIVLNHHSVTNRILLGFSIIFLFFVYSLFQERSSTLYCDKNQNFCELRKEYNIGIKTSKDLYSPTSIDDVITHLNFSESFVYGPIKLKRTGDRVYHSIYIVDKQKNQISIYTKYDNKYKNSIIENKMNRIAKDIKEELQDDSKDIIIYNITKAYNQSK